MLATLFPIRIVIRRRSGFLLRLTSAEAPRLPSSARDLARPCEIVKRAISEPEKKPESASKTTNRTIVAIMAAAGRYVG